MISRTGKKYKTLLFFLLLAIAGVAATSQPDEVFVNLKVLPKNIPSAQLEKIMAEDFQEGLGVTCAYCHVETDKAAHKFDYASDAKPEKDTARSMMRMTIELNKKYFNQPHSFIGDSTAMVTCYTCHHGNPVPKEK